MLVIKILLCAHVSQLQFSLRDGFISLSFAPWGLTFGVIPVLWHIFDYTYLMASSFLQQFISCKWGKYSSSLLQSPLHSKNYSTTSCLSSCQAATFSQVLVFCLFIDHLHLISPVQRVHPHSHQAIPPHTLCIILEPCTQYFVPGPQEMESSHCLKDRSCCSFPAHAGL